jgi:hypothetical protein
MRPDELERRVRERLDALGPLPAPELLHVLMPLLIEIAKQLGVSHQRASLNLP